MKKNLLTFVCLSAVVISLSSCKERVIKGTGAKSSELRNVGTFTEVELSAPLKANITMQAGATPSVKLSGYGNILSVIKMKVENGTLSVYLPSGIDIDDDTKDETILDITLPTLASLSLDGAADADLHGNLTGKDFSLDISGAGSAIADSINVETFTSDISGAGHLEINGGSVHSASYDISGSGKILAYPLQTIETETDISGSGKCEVTAQEKLTVSISGAGNIHYKGHPKVTQDVSGAGNITDAN